VAPFRGPARRETPCRNAGLPGLVQLNTERATPSFFSFVDFTQPSAPRTQRRTFCNLQAGMRRLAAVTRTSTIPQGPAAERTPVEATAPAGRQAPRPCSPGATTPCPWPGSQWDRRAGQSTTGRCQAEREMPPPYMYGRDPQSLHSGTSRSGRDHLSGPLMAKKLIAWPKKQRRNKTRRPWLEPAAGVVHRLWPGGRTIGR